MIAGGSGLGWLTWNHPNMPWDGCELWVGEIAKDGTIANQKLVAGGVRESIFQPEWSPDGTLYFVSDRTGWGNIYRQAGNGTNDCVCAMKGELRAPQRIFARSNYSI